MELWAERAENCGLNMANGPRFEQPICVTAPLALNEVVPDALQLAALSALFRVLVASPTALLLM